MENRYALNKQLAQMLKGGVIMDVTHRNRQRSQKQQVHAPSWHWSVFRLISARQEVYQE